MAYDYANLNKFTKSQINGLTGDFDAKLAYVVGEVEDFELFKERIANCPALSEGSLCKIGTTAEIEAEIRALERPYEPAKATAAGEALASVLFDQAAPSAPKYVDVDCDICSSCKEHASFVQNEDGETLSDCCDAPPVDVDCDFDLDR